MNTEDKKLGITLVNFVLLEKPEWDKCALQRLLKEMWDIEAAESEDDPESPVLLFEVPGATVAVSFAPVPVPNGEAEGWASENFLWPDAVETVKRHRAQLIVAVIGKELPPLETGVLLAKTVAACCKLPSALGVYVNQTVYNPEDYLRYSEIIREGTFPLLNLVWFGLYSDDDDKLSAYTCGMRNFGFDEIEIPGSTADAETLLDFLSSVAHFVLTADVTLQDGETIGPTKDVKFPITRSAGIAVEGDSLKIAFYG